MRKNKFKLMGTIVVLCTVFISLHVYAETLPKFEIMTEPWKPWQVEENGNVKGIAVDLLVQILERSGSDQNNDDIKMLPWARSYNFIQKKENTILFSMTRTAEREKMFKWVGPIFQNTTSLIARKDSNIKIESPEDIKKYKIGTIIDDVGESYLTKLGVPRDNWDRLSKFVVNVKKLNKKRIDMIVGTEKGLINNAITLNIDPNLFEVVYDINKADISYAFYKETPDWIIEKFQKNLDILKSEGVIDNLKKKYEYLAK